MVVKIAVAKPKSLIAEPKRLGKGQRLHIRRMKQEARIAGVPYRATV